MPEPKTVINPKALMDSRQLFNRMSSYDIAKALNDVASDIGYIRCVTEYPDYGEIVSVTVAHEDDHYPGDRNEWVVLEYEPNTEVEREHFSRDLAYLFVVNGVTGVHDGISLRLMARARLKREREEELVRMRQRLERLKKAADDNRALAEAHAERAKQFATDAENAAQEVQDWEARIREEEEKP